jgi:hypothetical protein
MIHRSRRHLATLPARRGMRAHWLRRRIPDENDAAAGAAAVNQDVAEPGAARPAQDEPTEPEQVDSTAPSAVRPAFGHPTF